MTDEFTQKFRLLAVAAENDHKAIVTAGRAMEKQTELLAARGEELAQVANSLPNRVQQATTAAVKETAKDMLGEMSLQVRQETHTALGNPAQRLQQIIEAVEKASVEAIESQRRFMRRWSMLAGVVALGFVAVVGACGWLVLGWFWAEQELAHTRIKWLQTNIAELEAEEKALAAQVEKLENTVETLENKGGKGELSDCGGKPCVRVNQGEKEWESADKRNSYRVIYGY